MIISNVLMEMFKTLYILELFDYEELGPDHDYFIEVIKLWTEANQ